MFHVISLDKHHSMWHTERQLIHFDKREFLKVVAEVGGGTVDRPTML